MNPAEVGLVIMGFSIADTIMSPIVGVALDCGLAPLNAVLLGRK